MNLSIDLHIANKDWRYVYNSILDFFSKEVEIAFTHARIFKETVSTSLKFSEVQEAFINYCESNNLNKYQINFIQKSIFIGTSQKITKPKKQAFKRLTNRTTYINSGMFEVFFDKTSNHVKIRSETFTDLDTLIREESFLSEFINMVNTINWPTKPGPSNPIRGCVMVLHEENGSSSIFYKAGNNPLKVSAVDSTVSEPLDLRSDIFKFSLIAEEQHLQPTEPQTPLMEEF